MDVTVALFVFKRPAETRRVFDAIARARPRRLLVVADGPRHPEERARCDEVRAIVERVEWECEVLRNYSDTNMGCRRRVSSGLDWVFSVAEEAIILEDDCLPDPSFFPYVAALLERYRHDDRLMHIDGDNFQNGIWRGDRAYYFSKYAHIWGWGTWRRAWAKYDVTMREWPAFRDAGRLRGVCPDPREAQYWTHVFDSVHGGHLDTWDYAWLFACWRQGGLCVHPNVNLVSNIGFTGDAAHTSQGGALANLPTTAIGPVTHPGEVRAHEAADDYTWTRVFTSFAGEAPPRAASGGIPDGGKPPAWRRLKHALTWRYGRWVRRFWRVRALATFRASLVVARVLHLPGTEFAAFGVSCARRCLGPDRERLPDLDSTPVNCLRYLEFPFVWRHVSTQAGARCLDISSPRLFTAWVLQHTGQGHVTLVNPDGRDIETTRILYDRIGCDEQRFALVNEYAEKLAFADGHFDVIWSISVIEHIPAPFDGEALGNLWRMLRVGGALILTVPAAAQGFDEYREDNVYGLARHTTEIGKGVFFERWYDDAMVRDRVLAHLPGAVVTESEVWGETRPGAFAAYLQRWVVRGEQETCRDPYMMASLFRRFGRLDELPGSGLLCLALRKDA